MQDYQSMRKIFILMFLLSSKIFGKEVHKIKIEDLIQKSKSSNIDSNLNNLKIPSLCLYWDFIDSNSLKQICSLIEFSKESNICNLILVNSSFLYKDSRINNQLLNYLTRYRESFFDCDSSNELLNEGILKAIVFQNNTSSFSKLNTECALWNQMKISFKDTSQFKYQMLMLNIKLVSETLKSLNQFKVDTIPRYRNRVLEINDLLIGRSHISKWDTILLKSPIRSIYDIDVFRISYFNVYFNSGGFNRDKTNIEMHISTNNAILGFRYSSWSATFQLKLINDNTLAIRVLEFGIE